MGKIRVLPQALVGKIAAGEVVERPASVVKELIENAIDAGARAVEVEVEDGGRSALVVSDDGRGIGAGDLAMLFTQHATSKLSTLDDLGDIRTLGFRGEALYSIGAVAEVRVDSRPEGSDTAMQVRSRAGEVQPPEPTGAPPGTRVEVRRLFFNVPARRKFLRSAATEFDQIRETVVRFALGHPALGLRLVRDGRLEFALPPGQDLRTRCDSLLSLPSGEAWIPLQVEARLGKIDGLLAPPSAARTTTRGMYFFVNGRFVRDRVLMRAVHEGYRDFLVSGRSAVLVLHVEVPPPSLDVNVHPAKSEIRFAKPGPLFDLLSSAVHDRLSGNLKAPGVVPSVAPGPDVRQAITEFFAPSPGVGAETLPELVTGRRVFQLHHRYLVEEVDDGIQIIDQHALHERVLLEELQRSYGSADLPRQRLLVGPSMQVSEEESGRLEEYRHVLESAGFSFEAFGPAAIRVTAVPALLSRSRPEALLRDFLDYVGEEKRGGVGIEQVLERLACRSAVRFGDDLPPDQIEALLRRRDILNNPHVCAHGRPVSIRLTLDELERFFRRK